MGCDGAARGEGVPSGKDAPGASVGRDAGAPGVRAAGARGGVGRVSGGSGGNGGGPPGVAWVGVTAVSASAGTGLSPARDEAGINTMSTQPSRNLRSRDRITFPGSAIHGKRSCPGGKCDSIGKIGVLPKPTPDYLCVSCRRGDLGVDHRCSTRRSREHEDNPVDIDDSPSIQHLIDRLPTSEAARSELLSHASQRLECLTRKMLRDYPGVHRWEQTDDVLQNASLRLYRALSEVALPSPRDFFRLAAAIIRRELIDLARHYSGPLGVGANHASVVGKDWHGDSLPGSDNTYDPSRLAEWTDFHAQVEALSDEDRVVVDLLFYQGMSQSEAAVVLDVSERTVKRRWQSARLALHQALGGRLPGT